MSIIFGLEESKSEKDFLIWYSGQASLMRCHWAENWLKWGVIHYKNKTLKSFLIYWIISSISFLRHCKEISRNSRGDHWKSSICCLWTRRGILLITLHCLNLIFICLPLSHHYWIASRYLCVYLALGHTIFCWKEHILETTNKSRRSILIMFLLLNCFHLVKSY